MNLRFVIARILILGVALLALSAGAQEKKEQKAGRGPQPSPKGVQVTRDIEYVPGGHERQKLDLYLPEKGENWPLIVWVHGGGWKAGSKDAPPALGLVFNGFAAASINYRLSQHSPWPAQIEDCKAAVRWLRANAARYHYDAKNIGVWGASAGGHLVAMLGAAGETKKFDVGANLDVSSKVQAVCDWFGPADFGKWVDSTHPSLIQLFGGPVTQAKAIDSSPVTYVGSKTPPFLIMHGDQDPIVAMDQSESLEASLKKAGVEVDLVKIPGAGHGGPQFDAPDKQKMVVEFFRKHLKNGGK